jgi:hypothetical protein
MIKHDNDLGEADERRAAAYRRRLGALLGAGLGLAYGLTSQWINALFLPGIRFYQPPWGPVGNTALSVAVGALIGLVSAWPGQSLLGALAGCAVGALLVEIAVLLPGDSSGLLAAKGVLGFFIFLPMAALLALPIGLVRWAVSKQEEARQMAPPWRVPAWKRVLLPLLLILAAAGLGALALYPERGRAVLTRMEAIVQAADRAALPAEMQAIKVDGYPERAKGRYTLDWEKGELSRFAIPRPLDNEWEQSAVIARFDNGWSFVCLFITPDAEPRCAPSYVEP